MSTRCFSCKQHPRSDCEFCIATGMLTLTSDDPVDHPPHYRSGGIETIDAIEAWGLNFHLGNVVKYISRAGKKDPAKTVEDLQKARWFLDREITRRTKGAT